MTIAEKLRMIAQMERRNNERWSGTREQADRQTAAEYSAREALMALYVR